MKLFFAYLKNKSPIILLFLLFSGIFALSFWLYRLPPEAVAYPAALCLGLGLLALLLDFSRVRKRQRLLARIQSFSDCQELPPAGSLEGAAWQRVVRTLSEDLTALMSQSQLRYGDMLDYYTAWVHQIKTPIAALHLKIQNEDSPFARSLNSELLRIEQYVDMVLTFLRLDSRDTDYVIRECSLDEILRQAIRKFSGEFISRKLRLVYTPTEATVLTDEKWLAFVVEQVLSNALKYTPSGAITIETTENQVLTIRDTGIGIAPEDLPRIFEKGYTGYNGRSDKKATGIGLYLCKTICKNLGHTITAASRPGEGTVISIGLHRETLVVE